MILPTSISVKRPSIGETATEYRRNSGRVSAKQRQSIIGTPGAFLVRM
ncbi:MAG: hypothetical protein HUK06_10120 [Bacteroidaceae bacterium]|nr:hypothetical protein [Bacteroidaceae bacterium]